MSTILLTAPWVLQNTLSPVRQIPSLYSIFVTVPQAQHRSWGPAFRIFNFPDDSDWISDGHTILAKSLTQDSGLQLDLLEEKKKQKPKLFLLVCKQSEFEKPRSDGDISWRQRMKPILKKISSASGGKASQIMWHVLSLSMQTAGKPAPPAKLLVGEDRRGKGL